MAASPLTALGQTAATPYPRLIAVIQGLRRAALALIAAIVATTLGFYFLAPRLFDLLQGHLHQRLVFFTVAEPFLAHVKLALATAILVLVPFISACLWRILAVPFAMGRLAQIVFTLGSSLLFYSGALFCYLITLTCGINFLLGFSSEQLQPVISINEFVSFVALFVIGFGLIFELPILMIFTVRSGILPRQVFEKNRRYAVLVISIVAALLTPTPDIFNMMLMGLPLYGLYEVGIIALKLMDIA